MVVAVSSKEGQNYPAYPAGSPRARLSADVPAELASEYWTASQILPYSEEASAAISRSLNSHAMPNPTMVTKLLAGAVVSLAVTPPSEVGVTVRLSSPLVALMVRFWAEALALRISTPVRVIVPP